MYMHNNKHFTSVSPQYYVDVMNTFVSELIWLTATHVVNWLRVVELCITALMATEHFSL